MEDIKRINGEVVCKNCGLVNDYTIKESGPHKTAICNGCDQYIKHLKTFDAKPELIHLYFGKYKGKLLSDLKTKEELSWVQWAVRNIPTLKNKEAYIIHLKQFNLGV